MRSFEVDDRGCAAAHCGKAPPFRRSSFLEGEAGPRLGGVASSCLKSRVGKAKPYLNPTAPQLYKVSIENGAKLLTIKDQDSSRLTKGSPLPIRVPVRASMAGSAELHASFTFVYCREDNTGTCRIKTLVWRAPVEVVSDANAPGEISVRAKVSGD